ncbi:LysR family transcriptional regulator [Roseateles aquatilis]|uniref:LysR family transcriptional regulator n=1 Tax=Roseateles aquatilis TaxID=431061 RepID=A0A246J4W0_9BURK|nr:LysR family transcriptional regulator [Roseateles aquatilis]OWQ87628.1 LysR family transcriptional regulator [Roseateles aquatilis]
MPAAAPSLPSSGASMPAAAPITHRHIEVFRAVMTAGSVTGAAQLLFTSQPTVSRELARLESLLGYTLFDRAPGRLRPTHRALALFDEVQRAYQGLDQVVARAQALGRAEDEGLRVLTLPALAHALLPAASADWLGAHPQAQLTLTPQESPLLEEWMAAQRFDIGLSEVTGAVPGTHSETLAELDEVCVLPASHPLLARQVLAPLDFEGERFVSLSAEDPYRRQFDAIFGNAGVHRRLQVETHSAIAVCSLVEQGLGIALVNPLTARACAGPGLHIRPFSVSVPFRIQALRPLHRPAHALTDDFIAAVKRALAPAIADQIGKKKRR